VTLSSPVLKCTGLDGKKSNYPFAESNCDNLGECHGCNGLPVLESVIQDRHVKVRSKNSCVDPDFNISSESQECDGLDPPTSTSRKLLVTVKSRDSPVNTDSNSLNESM
jgi:hypothetical protein